MIFDKLENLGRYSGIAPYAFAKLEEFFRNRDFRTLAPGKHPLDGEALRIGVSVCKTTPREKGKFEAHRDFADIHIVLAGRETSVFRADAKELTELAPFNEKTDCALYSTSPDGTAVELTPGTFILYFPGELHQPCVGDGTEVLKAIVKISGKLFR